MSTIKHFDTTGVTESKPVVVIGSGIAGSTAAYQFHKRGIPVLLIEKTEHFGGRMQSEHNHGAVFESGQQFYYSAYKNIKGLLNEMELEHHMVNANVIGYMCFEGKIAPFSKTKPWLGLLSAKDNISLWKAMANKVWPLLTNDIFNYRADDPNDQIDVAKYFGDRVSKGVMELAIRPMVTSYSFAEPEGHSLSMLLRIVKLGAIAKTMALTKGNDSLPKALASKVKTIVAEATDINIENDQVTSVTVMRNGVEETITTSHVVCAAPPPAAHKFFKKSRPALASGLEEIKYTATIMVNFELDRKLEGDGWVYTLSRHDGHRAAFAIDCLKRCPEAFPNQKSVIMVSFVNPTAGELMDADDKILIDICLEDMKIYIPNMADMVKDVSIVRRPTAVPTFQTGMFRKIRVVQEESFKISGLRLIGDYVRTPLIEGATRSASDLFCDDLIIR
ncbi:MAG: FAD-dependent oxidoreductase [Bacteriovoracaceae bacterium]|jgi:protoporphyrinogen/coproporphyrinogen III oxidase|nr:FAD-dependent oxidoreductase [Bacteriovoracaceae bacterium]